MGILRKLIIHIAFITLTHDLFTDLFLSLSHEFFITHRITPPHFFYAHTTRQIRPFPAGPCRCSRNSRVGLSGKQTVRGCWESSLGLQIIVWLTRVSEPARLLLHTCTHKVHTHEHMSTCAHDLCTLKAL